MSPYDALNAKQKECLRLVSEGLTSKQIAPRVGLTHESVNTYVKAAARLLGAPNRAVAARMLLEHEALPKGEFPSQPVEPAPQLSETEATDGLSRSPRSAPLIGGIMASVPPIGGSVSGLTAGEKVAAMLRAALFMSAVVATLILLIVGGLKLL